jgi:phosphonate degradation associated HDIG domain protein
VTRLSSLEDIEQLYAARGGWRYGEGVTQLEHALQCAALAEEHGSPPGLVLAALLHDIGHFFVDEAEAARHDDRHEVAGAQALERLFGEAVIGPIAQHVAAKRYLCFKEPSYFDALSAASKHTLQLQGGPFDAAQAAAFEHEPCWRDAVALRRFDDWGKREDAPVRTFVDYKSLMRSLLIARS